MPSGHLRQGARHLIQLLADMSHYLPPGFSIERAHRLEMAEMAHYDSLGPRQSTAAPIIVPISIENLNETVETVKVS